MTRNVWVILTKCKKSANIKLKNSDAKCDTMVKILTKSLQTILNLTDEEALVYTTTLQLGEASLLEIAEKSGVHRTSIYRFLESLLQRQILIATKKKKRVVYSAADPEQLQEYIQMKAIEFSKLLPDLRAVQNAVKNKPRVQFFEGVEGIKQVYNDTLKVGKSFDGYGDFEFSVKLMGDYFRDYYIPQRIRKGMLWRGILRDSPAAREWAGRDNKDLREARFLPHGDITTEINIYGNKVALVSFRSNLPFAVVIEDPDVARTQHVAWGALWDRLK